MNKFFYFLMIGIALHCFSCGSPAQMQAHISKESTLVATVDSKRFATKILMDKLGKLNLSDLFPSSSEEDPQAEKDSLSEALNPTELGIDLFSDIYASAQLEQNAQSYAVIYLKLSDSEKLENALKNKMPFAYRPKIQKKSGFEYGIISKKQTLVAWNDNFCMIFIALNPESFVGLETYFDKIANLPKEQQILQDANFVQIQGETADVKIWSQTASIQKINYSENLLGLDYFHSFIDFEKGQLSIKNKVFTNTAQNSALLKNYSKKLNIDDINNISEDQISAVYSFKYNPNEIKKQIENSNQSLALLPYLMQSGLTLPEFYSLFKGDVFFAAAQAIETSEEIVSYEYDDNFNKVEKKTLNKKTVPQILMATSCDQTAVKLLENLASNGLMQKKENYYSFGLIGYQTYFLVKDNLLLASTNLKLLQEKPAVTHNLGRYSSENPVFVYLDFQKVLKDYQNNLQGFSNVWYVKKGILVAERLEKLTIIGAESKENVVKIDITLDLMNKNENALFEILAIVKAASENKTAEVQ